MSRKNDIEEQISFHSRRLQALEVQNARRGINTPPEVTIEIEDIQNKLAELQAELQSLTEIVLQNPYRGLSWFREEDSDIFFGRDTFVSQLVEIVHQEPLVAVLGPSGSGKSSVVFAGLLPYLRRNGSWLITSFRPGSSPFLNLASALVPLLDPKLSKIKQVGEARDLANRLSDGLSPLSDYIYSIHQTFPRHRLLLLADQFEELYTLTQKVEIRHQFLKFLLAAINTNISSAPTDLHLVLTLRADFLGEALLYNSFGDAIQDRVKLLGPMNPDELRMAIEKPVKLQGVDLEAGLVERILTELSGEPGSLPLLEFTLTTLWERQRQGKLTHSAYEAIGGVEGALSHHADKVLESFRETERERARHIFTQMVQPGEGTDYTRRFVNKTELGEANWSLIQKLADARLVVTDRGSDGQEIAEIAHEALIGGWKQLREWLDIDRSFLMWRKRLRIALDQWKENQQDQGALLRSSLLIEAEVWLSRRESELGDAERNFIQASRALREHEGTTQARIRRQAETLFWISWVLLSTVGWAIGWAIEWTGSNLSDAVLQNLTNGIVLEPRLAQNVVLALLSAVIMAAMVGTVVGIMQWLVLRQQIARAHWWVVASITGWAMGWVAGFSPLNVVPTIVIVGTIVGTVVGIMQWLVLRQQIARAHWWVPVSIVGSATACAFVNIVVWAAVDDFRFVYIDWFDFVAITGAAVGITPWLIGALIGTMVGIMQWLVLRQQIARAHWWLLVSVAGWTMGWALAYSIWYPGLLVNDTMAGAMIGTMVGIMQWLALRQQIAQAGWRVLVGIAGWTIGSTVISSNLFWYRGGLLRIAIMAAMIATAVAIAQWLILRRKVARAHWWMLASIAGLVAGWAAVDGMRFPDIDWFWHMAIGGVLVGITQWLILRRKVARAHWWVLASIAGLVAGWAAVDTITRATANVVIFRDPSILSFEVVRIEDAVLGSIIMTMVSAMQWLILRQQIAYAGSWVLASIAGLVVGAIIANVGLVILQVAMIYWFRDLAIEEAVRGVMIGLMVGIMQWLVLRQQVARAHWWVLVSIVGLGVGLVISFAVLDVMRKAVTDFAAAAVGGAMGGVTTGAITGTALTWLLRRQSLEA